PGQRGVLAEAFARGHVHRPDPECAKRAERLAGTGAAVRRLPDHHGLELVLRRRRGSAGQRERLQGLVGQPAALVLDERQEHPGTSPSSRITLAARPAASGLVPRISTRLFDPPGTRSRTLRSPLPGHDGSDRAMGAFLARSRPGTDGNRGRLIPSFTATTAGSGSSKTSHPPEASRRKTTRSPATSMRLIPVTHGSPSAWATRTGTW